MKQRNQPSNRGDQPVTFRHSDAVRINACVTDWERTRRSRKPSQLPRAAGSGKGGEIVTATFLGSWFRGTMKVINFEGHMFRPSSTQTAICTNHVYSVYGRGVTAHRVCIVTPSTTQGQYILLNSAE